MDRRGSGAKADQPIDRMLAIIGEVIRLRRPATVSEIAERLDLPIPTTHRIVGQLLDRTVLKRQPGTTRVLVGPRIVSLAAEVLEAAMVADEPHRVLLQLAAEIGEHCHVGVMAEGHVLYIDSARSGRSHGLQFEPGRRSPLHCTSIGKIWLAELSSSEFHKWLSTAQLASMTSKTIVDPQVLVSAIETVRAEQWAASDEEMSEGVIGCAVPIRSASGKLLAALGVSVPKARMEFACLEGLVPRLREAAEDIGKIA